MVAAGKMCKQQKDAYKMPVKSAWTGVISAMLSAVIYGFNALIATVARNGGINEVSLTMLSAAVAAVVLFSVVALLKIKILPERSQILPIIMAGIFGGTTQLLLFGSYHYVSSGIATTLHFTYPTFVAVGGIFVLKQKLTKSKVLALLVSLFGVYLAADFSGSASMTGVVLAVISGITYASYILVMDKTGLKNMNFFKMCGYMAVMRALIAGLYGLCTENIEISANMQAWGMVLVLGLASSCGANILFQVGVRYTGASNASIFSMFEPVTSIIVGFLILNESMNALKFVGCVLILSGIIITVMGEKKKTD